MPTRTPRDPLAPVLASFHSQMGKVGDPVIAEAAGVRRHTVAAYRKRHGIPAYNRHLFKTDSEGGPESASPSARRPRPAGRATPAAPPSLGGAPIRTVISPRGSKMDPFVHLVGVLTDAEVAKLAGVTPTGVRLFRRRHKIPVAPVTAHAPRRSAAEKAIARAVPVSAPRAPSVASAPAPSVASAPVAPVEGPWRSAFRVDAVNGDQSRRIIVVARDIQDALARAVVGLAAQGGGWSVSAIKSVGAGVG